MTGSTLPAEGSRHHNPPGDGWRLLWRMEALSLLSVGAEGAPSDLWAEGGQRFLLVCFLLLLICIF